MTIHPKALENLARLPVDRAKRALMVWFDKETADYIARSARYWHPDMDQAQRFEPFNPFMLNKPKHDA